MPRPSARLEFPHRTLRDALAPGAVIPAGGTAKVIIPCAGASQIRIRAKATTEFTGPASVATLNARFLRPDTDVAYAAGQPVTAVAMAIDTEVYCDIACQGESRLEVELAGDASDNMRVGFVDVMGLPNL